MRVEQFGEPARASAHNSEIRASVSSSFSGSGEMAGKGRSALPAAWPAPLAKEFLLQERRQDALLIQLQKLKKSLDRAGNGKWIVLLKTPPDFQNSNIHIHFRAPFQMLNSCAAARTCKRALTAPDPVQCKGQRLEQNRGYSSSRTLQDERRIDVTNVDGHSTILLGARSPLPSRSLNSLQQRPLITELRMPSVAASLEILRVFGIRLVAQHFSRQAAQNFRLFAFRHDRDSTESTRARIAAPTCRLRRRGLQTIAEHRRNFPEFSACAKQHFPVPTNPAIPHLARHLLPGAEKECAQSSSDDVPPTLQL